LRQLALAVHNCRHHALASLFGGGQCPSQF
jgi:hypothetical protein